MTDETESKLEANVKTEVKKGILDAYVNHSDIQFGGIVAAFGAADILLGVFIDNTPLTILGLGGIGVGGFLYYITNTRAYMNASLDYMQNGRFTKLEDQVQVNPGEGK